MTRTRTSTSPLVGAAILLAVVLLFGAAAFVAGTAVGAGTRSAEVLPSPTITPAPTPGPTPILETVTCTEPSEGFRLLCETYARIKADYVDQLDDAELVEGAVQGMVEALPDPYSGYLPPEQYETALDDLSGEFGGIGAEVGMRNLADPGNEQACTVITDTCALVIVAPLDGSPAEVAGLRSGDVVLAVDGISTLGSTISESVFRVRGEAGTDVTLSIRREDATLEVTITRAVINLTEVSARMVAGDIGYLRLTTFTDRSPQLLRDALAGLLDAGASAIVFDLRDNPGGYLSAAQDVASQFVPAGELLFTVESGEDVQRWESEEGGLAQDPSIEVVVLINGGSASASEIVAASLSETRRATLVGEATFGKNTVQVWHELSNGGGLRLTTDRWFTPGHGSVADGGIAPDETVAAAEDPQSSDDPQLDRALQLLGG